MIIFLGNLADNKILDKFFIRKFCKKKGLGERDTLKILLNENIDGLLAQINQEHGYGGRDSKFMADIYWDLYGVAFKLCRHLEKKGINHSKIIDQMRDKKRKRLPRRAGKEGG